MVLIIRTIVNLGLYCGPPQCASILGDPLFLWITPPHSLEAEGYRVGEFWLESVGVMLNMHTRFNVSISAKINIGTSNCKY